ncbi:Ca2+-binding EF-hand superfamily protein [Crossiella equi]|uniref:Ca2+-binding EF-hand superfamily protein n=1 Tax=Crossiella equi TaxID=130796 RepID=A0ABS5A6N2_9PSEU|nr:EF-hand domain-containing protein [Crossiella equi]MBP2471966.1 Ca2+-binding EF-hand superfamily protein [Crossiella equi]
MIGQIEDLIRLKTERVFEALDTDGNGYLEWADFQSVVDRHLVEFQIDRADPRGQAFQAAYETFWAELSRHADPDRDGRVSLEEYLVGTAAAPETLYATSAAIGNALFEVIDTDGDGEVSLEEFVRMMCDVWGVPRADADAAFHKVDADGSGVLCRQEILTVAQEFLFATSVTAPGGGLAGSV